MNRIAYNIATIGGLGDRLPAPGTTAGSLPAIVGWWLAMEAVQDPTSRLVATVSGALTVFALGVWASAVEARRRGGEDPGAVVVDEVAGQWVAVLPALVLVDDPTPAQLAAAAASGFLLFRFFDIAKPWPVRSLERLPGGAGIMADDIGAGMLAAVVLAAALYAF